MAAFIPYFVLSPNTIMSILGYIKGPDKTVPTPAEDWRQATVDVVIPALNEENTIALCLESVARQTLKPRRIILIDDGSSDNTIEYAKTFCEINDMELIAIKRKEPIGKTPTIKRQSREFDSDVEFILDGDTIMESENYIERTVQELYQGKGIASACGTILPLRTKDRKKVFASPSLQKFLSKVPEASNDPSKNFFTRLYRGITNLYRGALYLFLQHFIYRGQMVFFGTMTNPVGCAVAYRRKYIKDLFDHYEPILGDDLTHSEDIFIGFALLNKGYRNIQLTDVYARSLEPEVPSLPRQVYLWSSSFLQSCYYFNSLLMTPFKSFKRFLNNIRNKRKSDKEYLEKRKIQEPYRQSFGIEHSKKYGRPMGWVLMTSAFEKVTFPVTLLILMILGLWEVLAITVIVETVLSLTLLAIIAKGRRVEYFFKGLLLTPLRYFLLMFDLFTIGRFAVDLWILKNRKWRK
ncbi:MAG: glycosyltransferase family 2 protein [Acidobacteriota bacterium]|nr:glycosyltransferase family 2 protein [Acidobacteriota bacterium]